MNSFCRYSILVVLICSSLASFGQDEGAAVAKARFARPSSIYVNGGFARTFGENIGDYSSGTTFEAGFLRRLNKLVSIGGFVSMARFAYDPSKTPTSPTDEDLFQGYDTDLRITSTASTTYRDTYIIDANYDFPHGYQLSLTGGDVSLTMVGADIKLNLVPVSDDSKFSVYAFAKPFVAFAHRDDVSGSGQQYLYEARVVNNNFEYDLGDNTWYESAYQEDWGPDGYPALGAENSVSGGLLVGPGIEFNPGKSVSAFVQAAFGYTLPVSFVSTGAFSRTTASYTNPSFPIIKKGFPSLSFQAGVSYNF